MDVEANMANRDPDSVKLGHWYTVCCEIDLSQIGDEEALDDVRYYLREALEYPEEDINPDDIPF